jgi:hypothetical protein
LTQCNVNRLVDIWLFLSERPSRGTAVSDALGLPRSYIYNHGLHQMEERGFLLSQDEKSRLYPFKICDMENFRLMPCAERPRRRL